MGWLRLLGSLALAFLIGTIARAADAPETLPFAVGGDRSARIIWSQRFASANDDWVNDLVLLANGHVMAVGFLNRRDGAPPSDWLALAAEISHDGFLIGQMGYGEGGAIDAFWSMREAGDGRRMFAGFTTRIGGGGINGYTLLAAPDGAILKENAFGGGGYDRFTAMSEATDGYIFLGHSQAEGSDKRRIFIVKASRDGVPLWERIHDAPESWAALYIEPAGDGGFIIAGGTTVAGDGDLFAMKVDSEGRELWRKRAGTTEWDEVNHGLVVRSDGSIVLTGYTHRRGEEANDLVAATLSPTGEMRRLERFGGTADDRAILAKPDAAGRIWIVGHSRSAGAGGSDLLIARLDRNGSFEDAALTFGGSSDDNGTAVLPLNDGSLILAGYSQGLGQGSQDAFVLRIGSPAWNRPHRAFKKTVVR